MDKITQLIEKGVQIPNPQSVEIAEDIDIDRIAGQGVTIHPGCRIRGGETLICQGAQIGAEGLATVVDCYVGPQVSLKGGFFQGAVFLKKSSCGLGAHVRQGTILEEEASIAHTVGLKQTILLPFVTLGSLINFCDCLMAGGTSRQNHSEVGSSYIHFNFTPNQDKATPSLIGDVPRGVMLNQSPIFLGGQGGLVGPCRLAFGTVVAAGTICRKDQLKENFLVMEAGPKSARLPFKPGGYRNVKRILNHNFNYIGNLIALYHWYLNIRRQFTGPEFTQELFDGLISILNTCIDERLKQLEKLREKLGQDQNTGTGSLESRLVSRWPQILDPMKNPDNFKGAAILGDEFCEMIARQIKVQGKDYLSVIKGLNHDLASTGSQWLQSIVDQVAGNSTAILDAE